STTMLLARAHLQQVRAASATRAVYKKFNRVLIANRGEIALRVMRTARKMGMESVAVYSEADRKALHARTADYAYCIGPAPANQSYLCADKVIDTALKAGAQAIHPGYGFLSENAIFANKCAEAGIVFIGPPAQAITDMGAKDISKRIMQGAKVPVVEGYHGEDQSDANLKVHAEKIGYPVMLKAVFGGGGKGMRIAFTPADFDEALASARSEARKSFGRDEMLVEKFVERPRHVEVQVFGDSHGNYVHLWERDCSVQRRHQKIIEEAPAPNIDHATRLRLGESAVKAAAAVNYVGAGTVEFIMDPRNDFYFMEMNTRLQVEHPVSELITGTDLVEWQLRVAQGETLPMKQADIPLLGHAFECRVYAEDTVEGAFMPSAGKMEYASFPTDIARVDTGVESGDEVSVHYDPMIAKVIVHGRDRAAASAALDAALAKTTIVGLPTNISFVRRILTHPEFAAGNVYTEFIPDHAKELFREEEVSKAELLEGALAQALSARVSSDKLFSQLVPFRVNHQPVYTKKCGTKSVDLVQKDENTWEADIDGEKTTLLVSSLSHSECGHELHFRVEADGEAWRTKAVRTESGTLVVVGKGEHTYEADAREWGDADGAAAAGGGHALAPMPGIVERILVKKGDVVKAGQALVVVVAMKMEYIIRASRDSVVEDVTCAPAQNVPRAAVLVKLTTADHP
ncbi:mccc-1, partial [Pristionchus pacificus]